MTAGRLSDPGHRTQTRRRDDEGIIPVLAQAVREVERAVTSRQLTSGQRSRFQAVALLARAERTRRPRRRHADRRSSATPSSSASTAWPRSWPRRPRGSRRCSTCWPRTPRSPTTPVGSSARCRPRPASSPSRSPSRRARRSRTAYARAEGAAAVGAVGPAGQPVPGARLQPGRTAGAGSPGRLGADRAAAELLRAGRARRAGVHGAARPAADPAAQGPRPDAAPGAAAGLGGRGPPDLPPGRRARPRQDRAGAARRAGRERLPAAGDRPQRRQDQLGARGRDVDPQPHASP